MYQTPNTWKRFAWHLINAQWKLAALFLVVSLLLLLIVISHSLGHATFSSKMIFYYYWLFCALSNEFEVWAYNVSWKCCQKFERHYPYTWINLSLLIHKLGIPLYLFSSFSQSESTFIIYSIKINTYLLYFFLATL